MTKITLAPSDTLRRPLQICYCGGCSEDTSWNHLARPKCQKSIVELDHMVDQAPQHLHWLMMMNRPRQRQLVLRPIWVPLVQMFWVVQQHLSLSSWLWVLEGRRCCSSLTVDPSRVSSWFLVGCDCGRLGLTLFFSSWHCHFRTRHQRSPWKARGWRLLRLLAWFWKRLMRVLWVLRTW